MILRMMIEEKMIDGQISKDTGPTKTPIKDIFVEGDEITIVDYDKVTLEDSGCTDITTCINNQVPRLMARFNKRWFLFNEGYLMNHEGKTIERY